MKFKILAIALLLPSIGAFASDTVTFTGEVANSTCNVTVNGTSGSIYVQLPTVQLSQLSNGQGAGGEDFTFTVSDCTSSDPDTPSTSVGIRLVPTVNAVTAAGNLTNTSTATNKAGNVGIQILDGGITGTAINFSEGEYTGTKEALPSTTTTFTYGARYFAEGTPTVGKVESQLQYALTYE